MARKVVGIKDQAEKRRARIRLAWLGLFTKVRLGSIVHHHIAVFISLLTFQIILWPYNAGHFGVFFPRLVVGAHILTHLTTIGQLE